MSVTVWAVLQLALVNVTVAEPVVTSPVSDETTLNTTSEAGSAFKTSVKSSVSEPSVTEVAPPDWVIVNPAVSLSVFTAATV